MKTFVKCLDRDGYHSLTVGKAYELLNVRPEEHDTEPSGGGFTWPETFTVIGDFGEPVTANAYRFTTLPCVKAVVPHTGLGEGLIEGCFYPLLEVHCGNFHTPETMYTVAMPNGGSLTTYAWRFEAPEEGE